MIGTAIREIDCCLYHYLCTFNFQAHTLHGTGIAMLFSAGTFIYVSTMHVLPEVKGGGTGNGFSKCELLMLSIGIVLPLLLTFGHHH